MISKLFVCFIFYSFLGWVWETIYCTVKEKHFQNRGFLFGPVCPIYGFSVIALQILGSLVPKMNLGLPLWGLFLLCAVGSAVMEYLTSWYLEKRFHARWWDYSRLPLNLNGRICLPVSIGFGLGGVAIVRLLLPAVTDLLIIIPSLLFEFAALLLMGVFCADFALTEESLKSLIPRIEKAEEEFATRSEAIYQTVSSTPQQIEDRIKLLEDEMKTRTRSAIVTLTSRQKYIMNNIMSYRTRSKNRYMFSVGEKLREAIHRRDS